MPSLLLICAAMTGLFGVYLAIADVTPRAPNRLLAAAVLILCGHYLLTAAVLGGLAPGWAEARPVLAVAIAPLLFLHLKALRDPGRGPRLADAAHFAGPAVMALTPFVLPGLSADIPIFAVFGLYLILILMDGRGEPAGPQRTWRRVLAGWMIAVLIGDAAIVLELAKGRALSASVAFMLSAALMAAFAAYAILFSLSHAGRPPWRADQRGRRAVLATPGDEGLFARLEDHMRVHQVYLDPDLTLARLARRIGRPARDVSHAVNAVAGTSFSDWLRSLRVAHAQALILDDPDRSFTDVMLASGFQTRSAFNAAFKAVAGVPPSRWRDDRLSSAGGDGVGGQA